MIKSRIMMMGRMFGMHGTKEGRRLL